MRYAYERLVEWGDCDDFGIVYYPHYFEWFDSAFHRMCLTKGYTQRNLREKFGAQGTPLIDADVTFSRPHDLRRHHRHQGGFQPLGLE